MRAARRLLFDVLDVLDLVRIVCPCGVLPDGPQPGGGFTGQPALFTAWVARGAEELAGAV
jgi:hypothetical protein